MAPRVTAYTNDRGEVSMRDPDSGGYVWVPKGDLSTAMAAGYQPEDRAQYVARQKEKLYDRPVTAGALGVARGLTGGLSDVALGAVGFREDLAGLKQENPLASGVGDVLGTVGSAAIPGAPLARAGGAAAKLGARVAAKAGTGAVGKVAAATLPAVARGVAEGVVIGAGSGISHAGITGKVDPRQIAERALHSAALGGALGLAGAGISAGIKAGGRALMRRAGPQGKQMDALLRQRDALQHDAVSLSRVADDEANALMGSIREAEASGPLFANDAQLALRRKLGGWKGRSGTAPHEVAGKLEAVSAEISQLRRSMFAAAGQKVASSNQALGAIIGFGAQSWMAGGVGYVASSMLRSGAVQKAISGVIKAGVRAAPTVARGGRAGALSILSQQQISSMASTLQNQDPGEIHQDAAQGYMMAGVPQGVADELAAFQASRAAFLRDNLPRDGSAAEAVRFSALVRAAQNPKGIVKRIREDIATTEDVETLRALLPAVHSQVTEAARQRLEDEEAKIATSERSQLRLMVAQAARSRTAQTIQAARDALKEERAAKTNKVMQLPRGDTPLQQMAIRGQRT